MKKILFTTVSALALAAFADGVNSTEFGVLTVPSSSAQTIVSVPWLASSNETAAVKVADLVLTSGLNVGDELKYYTGSEYQCWKLIEDGGVKRWEAAKNLGESGNKIDNPTEDKATLSRGNALILKRGTPIAEQFYIMGKPYSGSEKTFTISGGSLAAPVYNLVAPPTVGDVKINDLNWTGVGSADSITMPDGKSLIWAGGKWYKRGDSGYTNDITIPAGAGVWFCSKTEGNKTYTIQ